MSESVFTAKLEKKFAEVGGLKNNISINININIFCVDFTENYSFHISGPSYQVHEVYKCKASHLLKRKRPC
jgi:hypothetical protein